MVLLGFLLGATKDGASYIFIADVLQAVHLWNPQATTDVQAVQHLKKSLITKLNQQA